MARLIARGARVTVTHGASRLERLLPLVLAGLAVGITQRRAVADRPATDGVVYRPLSGDPVRAEHRLVWRREQNSAVHAFVAAVRALRDEGRLAT